MEKLLCINLANSQMKFAAGHFTIFNATERENMHGHNFVVSAKLYASMQNNGLVFDYSLFKHKFAELCQTLDEKFLIAEHSPFLTITEESPYTAVNFNGEKLLYLARDIQRLPVMNISIECLAQYFLDQVIADSNLIHTTQVKKIKVRVASSPSQYAEAKWHLAAGVHDE